MKARGWLGLRPLASVVLLLDLTARAVPQSAVHQSWKDSSANTSLTSRRKVVSKRSAPKASKRGEVSLVKKANASELPLLHPGLRSGNPGDLDELIRSAKHAAGHAAAAELPAAKSGSPQELDELIRLAKSGVSPGQDRRSVLPPAKTEDPEDLEELIRSAKADRGSVSGAVPRPPAAAARHGDDWDTPQSSRHGDDFEENELNDVSVSPSVTRSPKSEESPFLAQPHIKTEPLVQPLEETQPLGEASFVPPEVGNIPEDQFLAGLKHGKHGGKSIAYRREEETAAAVAKEETENSMAWKPRRGHHHRLHSKDRPGRRAVVAGSPLPPTSEQTKHLLSTHNLVDQIESEAATAEADHVEVRYREPAAEDRRGAPNATFQPKGPARHSVGAANLAASGGGPRVKVPPPVPMPKSGSSHERQPRCLVAALALAALAAPWLT
jgi:hypothetical protein